MTPEPSADRVTLLGIRHHGPGFGALVRGRAGGGIEPDVVLIEGPPEADALVALAADEGMTPPVALLAYVAGRSGDGGVLAVRGFSPEWQALRWAAGTRRAGAVLRPARRAPRWRCRGRRAGGPGGAPIRSAGWPRRPATTTRSAGGRTSSSTATPRRTRSRRSTRSPRRWPCCARAADDGGQRDDCVREAHMRQVLRGARKDGGDRIAVVCGAWHVPALAGTCRPRPPTRALLSGLPKVKADADLGAVDAPPARPTHAGYGAGIDSPGWYEHLFSAPDRPIDALADHGGRAAARARTSRSRPRTSSRPSGSPRRSPRCAAARCPAWPRSPRPTRPCCATATTCRSA